VCGVRVSNQKGAGKANRQEPRIRAAVKNSSDSDTGGRGPKITVSGVLLGGPLLTPPSLPKHIHLQIPHRTNDSPTFTICPET
jgi:hypothetical protein